MESYLKSEAFYLYLFSIDFQIRSNDRKHRQPYYRSNHQLKWKTIKVQWHLFACLPSIYHQKLQIF